MNSTSIKKMPFFHLMQHWTLCDTGMCVMFSLNFISTNYVFQENEKIYPLLYRVALDILPVQASAVPCERIFSSSKETCTLRHSLLSGATLEVLQVLKYLYRQERLDFSSHWVAKEEDYSIDSATEAAISELISSAK